jgi:hypothetical protein
MRRHNRQAHKLAMTCILSLAALAVTARARAGAAPPNVVVILADDKYQNLTLDPENDRKSTVISSVNPSWVTHAVTFPVTFWSLKRADRLPRIPGTTGKAAQRVGQVRQHVYLIEPRALDDAGAGDDPVRAMLLEHLCLAHFRIAQIYGDAQHAKTPEAARTSSSAAARLLCKFRRTALGLNLPATGYA